MKALEKNISENNKIPGSGCESFTRPEEIKALSKFLGSIRKAQEESMQLENELMDVPGKTTGKFPIINNLPNSTAQIDLSREKTVEDLNKKIVSLDKNLSNSSENIELSNKIIFLSDTKNIALSNEKLALKDTKDVIELDTTKESLEVIDNINLDTTKESLEVIDNINLDTTKESLEVIDNINLDTTKESLEVTDNISLDTTKESLEVTDDINLDTTKESLEVTDNINLDTTKESLEVIDNINLDTTKESLEVIDNINLDTTKESLEVIDNINLDTTKESLEVTDNINLDTTKESLEVIDNISLDTTKESLEVIDNISLDTTKESLEVIDNINLDTTKESLEVIDNINLDTTKESLEVTKNDVELSIFLDYLVEDSSTADINLETDIDKLFLENTKKDILLYNDSIGLNYEDSINSLSDKIVNLEIVKDSEVDLEDLIIQLDVNNDTYLPDFIDVLYDTSGEQSLYNEEDKIILSETSTNDARGDSNYDYFNNSEKSTEQSLYGEGDKIILSETSTNDARGDSNYDYFENNSKKSTEQSLYDSVLSMPETLVNNARGDSNYDYFDNSEKSTEQSLYSEEDKIILSGTSTNDARGDSNYDYFENNPESTEQLLYNEEDKIKRPIDWIKRTEGDKVTESVVLDSEDFSNPRKPRKDFNKLLKSPTIGKHVLSGTSTNDARNKNDYDYFENNPEKSTEQSLYSEEDKIILSETSTNDARDDSNYNYFKNNSEELTDDELYEAIIRFEDLKNQTNTNNSGNLIPDSYNNGQWYDMDKTDDENISTGDSYSENIGKNWFSKIKSIVSSYLNSGAIHLDSSRVGNFENQLFSSARILEESIKDKLSNRDMLINLPSYKLGEFNSINPSKYLRWIVENTIGNVKGNARNILLKETLALLIWGRDLLEKATNSSKYRLPGDSGLLGDFLQGGADLSSAVKTAGSAISSIISKDFSNPVNRPQEKTYGWKKANIRPGMTDTTVSENTVGDLLGNSVLGKSLDNDYSFSENYLKGVGIETTLLDLAGTSVGSINGGSVEDFFKILKDSPYITTADKVVTTGEYYNTTTLDSNSFWEVVFEPYLGNLNGNYTFLPPIDSINKRNETIHGVKTSYSYWIPFTSFDLQKEKMVSKTLGLFDGEISYPTSIEFTNELRLTIADDQFKSWRNYFETCMYAAVYSSNPCLRDNISEFNTIIDRNYQLIAPYKNLTFRCRVYIMTPQKSTITKFDLLLVLKDFSSEYSGEIDSSGTDLTVSFSIVGENPPETDLENIEDIISKNKSNRESYKVQEREPNIMSNVVQGLTNNIITLIT